MTWTHNQYYPLPQAGKDTIAAAVALLRAYPLTTACLEILGKQLLAKLEFGFFMEGQEFITQGESGRDMFLLCGGKVDVLVNGQVVVQMEGPVLLGDKALVEPKSKRAASIRVAKDQTALLIKIPMGLFIKNFGDPSIPDSQFSQEVSIFAYLFQGIQQRLFNYVYVQKNLWETVNTSLKLANSTVIAKMLDQQKNMNWDKNVWDRVKRFLSQDIGFKWDDSIAISPQTFREKLWEYLDQRFPRKIFSGSDSEYVTQKLLIWNTWLNQISAQALQALPENKWPISIGELELFNPRNYHMRLTHMLRGVESKFSAKNDTHPAITSFFGKGEQSNEFELDQYLKSFEQTFSIPHPKRMQAQVAQRVAQIAATCENQFNGAIAKMQNFLVAVQKKFNIQADDTAPQEDNTIELSQKLIQRFSKSFVGYEKKVQSISQSIGELKIIIGFTPTIEDLIKSSPVKQNREEMEKIYLRILDVLDLRAQLTPVSYCMKHWFLSMGTFQDHVLFNELNKQYWMVCSPEITISLQDSEITSIPVGMMVGGPGWLKEAESRELKKPYQLNIPAKTTSSVFSNFLFVGIVPQELPWTQDKNPSPDIFVQHHLPLMQWLINKHIEFLKLLTHERDRHFNKGFEVERSLRLEKKVKAFETGNTEINALLFQHIQKHLAQNLRLKLESSSLNSEQIAKKIYNHILVQMGEDYPGMPLEERSNKSYTKWRFALSELIAYLDSLDKSMNSVGKTVQPVWEIIKNEISSVLETYLGGNGKESVQLDKDPPALDISSILTNYGTMQVKMLIFRQSCTLLERWVYRTLEEVHIYKQEWENLSKNQTQDNHQKIQLELIRENATRLQQTLGNAA
ncbi:MAG: hypothetical protein HQM12_01750 [SAR324 cluster bacterium]|nr:hypothetical protein [SAR324 cluster bacterium]